MATVPTTMRAAVRDAYGTSEAVEVRTVAVPTPGPGQVLIRVEAASVNPLDWHYVTGLPLMMRPQSGLRRPTSPSLGTDVAGTIVALGADVTTLSVGDRVHGSAPGALAEYAATSADSLVVSPERITAEQAGAVAVAGVTALQAIDDVGAVRADQSVLVNGAAGGVGTFAVQIAVARGARVTAVCSGPNVDLVRSLGAHEVVDYTTDDVTARGVQYDVIIDNIGNHSFAACRRMLTGSGRYVVVGGPEGGRLLGPMARLLQAKVAFVGRSQRCSLVMAKLTTERLTMLNELMAGGAVTPVVGRTVPLDDAAAAFALIASGHARGKVVVVP